MPSLHQYHEDMATANRLLDEQSHDMVRKTLLIGNVSTFIFPAAHPVEGAHALVLARYPYNPSYHVWTQMTIYLAMDGADFLVFLEYTINDGQTWTSIPVDNTGDAVCGTDYRGNFAVDLSSIVGPTWIGARISINPPGTVTGHNSICRSHVYLERPGY